MPLSQIACFKPGFVYATHRCVRFNLTFFATTSLVGLKQNKAVNSPFLGPQATPALALIVVGKPVAYHRHSNGHLWRIAESG